MAPQTVIMQSTPINALPVELLLYIFEHLDSPPPSDAKSRQEPSLQLVRSHNHAIKNVSCVSRVWRRVALPVLFKHSCLRLDNHESGGKAVCSVCGLRSLTDPAEPSEAVTNHVQTMIAMKEQVAQRPSNANNDPPDNVDGEALTARWALRFYHAIQDYLNFVQKEQIAFSIQSFVLMSDRMLSQKLDRFPHESGGREWRYPGAAAMWNLMLSVIDPCKISILAPPLELACLTNAAIDTFGDWAFSDMSFHLLDLARERETPRHHVEASKYQDLKPFPRAYPSFASPSVLLIRDWTRISLNEGSFLKAYGTYEYFERGPPSLVYSINQCFMLSAQNMKSNPGAKLLAPLRSFTYTGIFPFANHAVFNNILRHIEEFDVRFAPDLDILDDAERVGKAVLEDCWQELLSAYYTIASALSTHRMSEERFPRLKRFVSRDVQVPGIKDDLDEIFTPLCLPVWAEMTPGVFVRQAMSPRLPGVDDGV